ncbi:hypothetical protein LIER_35358 [Lithospermum erythrorhizon]|uniref:Secreted protein n=1 Tax=Lithospermum erythrorhizon TaxID=34254 RepID=A0AAV3NU44_LITER
MVGLVLRLWTLVSLTRVHASLSLRVRRLHSSYGMLLALVPQIRRSILLVWLQRSWMRPHPFPFSIQRIESIFRDFLRVAWVELCSLVEGRSHEALLAEEESILASFGAVVEFSRQDLTYHILKLIASRKLRARLLPLRFVTSLLLLKRLWRSFLPSCSMKEWPLGRSVPPCGSQRIGPPI